MNYLKITINYKVLYYDRIGSSQRIYINKKMHQKSVIFVNFDFFR